MIYFFKSSFPTEFARALGWIKNVCKFFPAPPLRPTWPWWLAWTMECSGSIGWVSGLGLKKLFSLHLGSYNILSRTLSSQKKKSNHAGPSVPEGTCTGSLTNSPRWAQPSNYSLQRVRHLSEPIMDPADQPIRQLDTLFHTEQTPQTTPPKSWPMESWRVMKWLLFYAPGVWGNFLCSSS